MFGSNFLPKHEHARGTTQEVTSYLQKIKVQENVSIDIKWKVESIASQACEIWDSFSVLFLLPMIFRFLLFNSPYVTIFSVFQLSSLSRSKQN